jgi:UDP-galactopyranose mutase
MNIAKPQLANKPDVVCLSHLRWGSHQRPQQLMSRCARDCRVFFVEDPVFDKGSMRLEVNAVDRGLWTVVSHLPEGLRSAIAQEAIKREMLNRFFEDYRIGEYVLWYYTPIALDCTRHFNPVAMIYDCMDELSGFKSEREEELLRRADLVFTSRESIYEVLRQHHPATYSFPSGVDQASWDLTWERMSQLIDGVVYLACEAGVPLPPAARAQ